MIVKARKWEAAFITKPDMPDAKKETEPYAMIQKNSLTDMG